MPHTTKLVAYGLGLLYSLFSALWEPSIGSHMQALAGHCPVRSTHRLLLQYSEQSNSIAAHVNITPALDTKQPSSTELVLRVPPPPTVTYVLVDSCCSELDSLKLLLKMCVTMLSNTRDVVQAHCLLYAQRCGEMQLECEKFRQQQQEQNNNSVRRDDTLALLMQAKRNVQHTLLLFWRSIEIHVATVVCRMCDFMYCMFLYCFAQDRTRGTRVTPPKMLLHMSTFISVPTARVYEMLNNYQLSNKPFEEIYPSFAVVALLLYGFYYVFSNALAMKAHKKRLQDLAVHSKNCDDCLYVFFKTHLGNLEMKNSRFTETTIDLRLVRLASMLSLEHNNLTDDEMQERTLQGLEFLRSKLAAAAAFFKKYPDVKSDGLWWFADLSVDRALEMPPFKHWEQVVTLATEIKADIERWKEGR